MIKFKRRLYDLGKLQYDYIDTDVRSRHVFRILEMPETFNLGKNTFKLLANNDVLLKNSRIYIDIVDANGSAIYYEVSPLANKDNSRSIIVYIYADTPPGNCTVRLASRLFKNPITKEDIYFNNNIIDEPNVLWTGTVNVSPYLESESRIKFLEDPVIQYRERLEQLQMPSGSTRLINLYANHADTIAMTSVVEPKQMNPSINDVERSDLSRKFVVQPQITYGRGTSDMINLPYFTGLSTIRSTNFTFSASMVGGVIYVNGINIECPAEAITTSSFVGLSYSASIVRVLSNNLIEVIPSFQRSLSYKINDGTIKLFSAKSFSNHGDFTASFYQAYALSASMITQSFMEINAYGIESISGLVDSLNVSYKSINSFGDFESLGDFKVDNKNLLVDSSSISFSTVDGVVERPIGKFPNGVSDFELYWVSGSNVESAIYSIYDKSSFDVKVLDGLFLKYGNLSNDSEYIYFKPKDLYSVYAYKNTEFNLKISSYLETSDFGHRESQIDIYISGSNSIYSDLGSDNLLYPPIKNNSFGIYIGSISANNGVRRFTDISFLVRDTGNILPVFVLRSGQWHFGDIELKPRKELGYSPNQTKIFVPLRDTQLNSELIFKVEYKDKVGIRSENDTKLYGVYFSRTSGIPPSIQDITGPGVIYKNQSHERGLWERLILGNRGQLQLSYTSSVGESSTVYYITQSSYLNAVAPATTEMFFPIFRDNINNSPHSGLNIAVGVNFQAETVVFGKTGSFSAPMDTYVWSSTIQGRAIVSKFDTSGNPLLFNVNAFSGSNNWMLGNYGSGSVSPKKNLDSWITSPLTWISGDSIGIRHVFSPSSSYGWDVYYTCAIKINKIEIRY